MSDKEDYEIRKLRAEVRDAERPWLLRHFPGVATFVVAAASIGLGFYTGLFDAQHATLELQKERLQKDIHEFQATKEGLESAVDSLRKETVVARKTMASLQDQVLNARIEKVRSDAALRPISERAQYYAQEVERAKKLHSQQKGVITAELEAEFGSTVALKKQMLAQNQRMRAMERDTALLSKRVKVLLNNPFIPERKEQDFLAWYHDRMKTWEDFFKDSKYDAILRQHDSSDIYFDSIGRRLMLDRKTK